MTSGPITASKNCPDCGERCPAHFDLCWSCGAVLSENHSAETVAALATVDESDAIEPAAAVAELSNPVQAVDSADIAPSTNWMRAAEVIAVVMLTVGHSMLWWLGRNNDIEPNDWRTAAQIPAYAAWVVLLWLLVCKDTAVMQPVSLPSTRWFRELLLALPIVACGVMLSFAVSIVCRTLDLPYVPIDRERFTPSSNVPLIVVFYLVAAAYEEVLFRVYLQSKLLALFKGRALPAILLPAALFAVSHFYPLRQSISAFAFGAFYGLLFYGFRSAPRLVFAHWLQNLLIALGR